MPLITDENDIQATLRATSKLHEALLETRRGVFNSLFSVTYSNPGAGWVSLHDGCDGGDTGRLAQDHHLVVFIHTADLGAQDRLAQAALAYSEKKHPGRPFCDEVNVPK